MRRPRSRSDCRDSGPFALARPAVATGRARHPRREGAARAAAARGRGRREGVVRGPPRGGPAVPVGRSALRQVRLLPALRRRQPPRPDRRRGRGRPPRDRRRSGARPHPRRRPDRPVRRAQGGRRRSGGADEPARREHPPQDAGGAAGRDGVPPRLVESRAAPRNDSQPLPVDRLPRRGPRHRPRMAAGQGAGSGRGAGAGPRRADPRRRAVRGRPDRGARWARTRRRCPPRGR